MSKSLSFKTIINYSTVILLLIAIAIRAGASFEWLKPEETKEYSLNDFKHAFPLAESFNKNSDQSFSVYGNGGVLLGHALVSEELNARYSGYAGEVPLVISLSEDKIITGIYLLPNGETSHYIEHIRKIGLLHEWSGMPLDTLVVQKQVDAVSGATRSSTAIIGTFNQTVANYLVVASQRQPFSMIRGIQIALMLALIVISLMQIIGKRLRQFYFYYLAGVVLVMGIWLKQMLSVGAFHTWLVNGLPWQTNFELIVILLLALVMALLGHKKYYCNYLCPMGALQMLVSKISPIKKRSINIKISVIHLNTVYLSFIWIAILLGISLPLSSMEPFMAFSFSVATTFMLLFGGVVMILSIFFNRPWCQFCPTGCAIDIVKPVIEK
ncbi:FMN-binding protein [Natronoflexus pectinivorans]|uniref:4Fe-4S binding protein n=1 Tax=Natronoflexus pectinivorans TaxID=682526 RepID=A0A4R2G762_9BACT|nr:FMN-binding protein [Natronoflexus pectinivorans]TCO03625.1 4Fe-4S binding protein [Natronoflexus pectinivorans]